MTDTRPRQPALTPLRAGPTCRHILTDHRDVIGITAGHRRLAVADHRRPVSTAAHHDCAGHTASHETRNTARRQGQVQGRRASGARIIQPTGSVRPLPLTPGTIDRHNIQPRRFRPHRRTRPRQGLRTRQHPRS
ncbi:hypothetical protein PV350_38850, partial [Streptomyces sp. PA03-6a]|nr:hypothetical protein [Streptomyces sp. PA03-6a]